MKILLDIKDDKAVFFMELLKNFPFVKAKAITPAKAKYMQELAEAVNEVNEAKKGYKKLKSAQDLLNEL